MILETIITVLMCSALVGAYCHYLNSKRISKLEKKFKKQKRKSKNSLDRLTDSFIDFRNELDEFEQSEDFNSKFPEPFKVESSAN